MSPPEKFKDQSVFLANKAQVELMKEKKARLEILAYAQSLEAQADKGVTQAKVLKSIIPEQNRLKDPMRNKKSVKFYLQVEQEDDEESDDGRSVDSGKEEELKKTESLPKDGVIRRHEEKKPPLVFVVETRDEVTDQQWKAKKFHLSLKERN